MICWLGCWQQRKSSKPKSLKSLEKPIPSRKVGAPTYFRRQARCLPTRRRGNCIIHYPSLNMKWVSTLLAYSVPPLMTPPAVKYGKKKRSKTIDHPASSISPSASTIIVSSNPSATALSANNLAPPTTLSAGSDADDSPTPSPSRITVCHRHTSVNSADDVFLGFAGKKGKEAQVDSLWSEWSLCDPFLCCHSFTCNLWSTARVEHKGSQWQPIWVT